MSILQRKDLTEATCALADVVANALSVSQGGAVNRDTLIEVAEKIMSAIDVVVADVGDDTLDAAMLQSSKVSLRIAAMARR